MDFSGCGECFAKLSDAGVVADDDGRIVGAMLGVCGHSLEVECPLQDPSLLLVTSCCNVWMWRVLSYKAIFFA